MEQGTLLRWAIFFLYPSSPIVSYEPEQGRLDIQQPGVGSEGVAPFRWRALVQGVRIAATDFTRLVPSRHSRQFWWGEVENVHCREHEIKDFLNALEGPF